MRRVTHNRGVREQQEEHIKANNCLFNVLLRCLTRTSLRVICYINLEDARERGNFGTSIQWEIPP